LQQQATASKGALRGVYFAREEQLVKERIAHGTRYLRVLASCLAEDLLVLLQASAGKGGSRAVYIAPKEELAKERFADWTQKFGSPGLGLNVCMLTGDPLADYAMLREANIVISTPEYWDMLSRRWRQPSRKEVQKVALFIVDELHLIGGANGSVLEVCFIFCIEQFRQQP